jgi:hypothetical protein
LGLPEIAVSMIWSNLGTYELVALGVGLALALLRVAMIRLKIAIPATAKTWQSYLRGQGTILFFFLLLGAALGWLSVYVAPEHSVIQRDTRLTEFRKLALSDQPVYEDVVTNGYGHLTIFAKTLAPDGSKARIRILSDKGDAAGPSNTVFDLDSTGWSRLDEKTSADHLTLVITTDAAATRATEADILISLSK